MTTVFSSVILSDNHVLALENRAFREGAIGEDSFIFNEFIRPQTSRPAADEAAALDLLCLYDTVIAEQRRFELTPLNKMAGKPVVIKRPDTVRGAALDQDLATTGYVSSSSDLSPQEFDELRQLAADEAQYLLRRDIDWYLLDAKLAFESQAPRSGYADPFAVDIDHGPVASVLRSNLFWLVDVFQDHFEYGHYGHLLDVDDLAHSFPPRELLAQIRLMMKTSRFEAYFIHLQEAYSNLFDSAFLGRVGLIEIAYERAPDRRGLPGTDTAAASRVIRVNLADVADYFPLPRSVEEAIETKEHPRVRAFREVLDRWLASVGDDASLEAKIRRELVLANRDLRILKSLRQLKQKPIFFGVKTALSLFPLTGPVVVGADAIEYFFEKRATKRAAWVVVPRDRLD